MLSTKTKSGFSPEQSDILSVAAKFNCTVSQAVILYAALRRGMTVQATRRERIFTIDGIYTNGTFTMERSWQAAKIKDKSQMALILAAERLPVSSHRVCKGIAEAVACAGALGYPVVVKPLAGSHGHRITCGVMNGIELTAAFIHAAERTQYAIVERFYPGCDYRFLICGDKVSAIAERRHAAVIGDGHLTVSQLIDKHNWETVIPVQVGRDATVALERQGYTMRSVVPVGERVKVRTVANVSAGGTSRDVTGSVHESYKDLALAAHRTMALEISGVDMIIEDVSKPGDCVILEVNSRPEVRLHMFPYEGDPVDVGFDVIDTLFPKDKSKSLSTVQVERV